MEIDYGPFERRIALDEPVDSEAADATYERGLLTIRLPVTKRAAGPVRVTVTRERA
jgi:HSP20 family molecular chaperone IbpA